MQKTVIITIIVVVVVVAVVVIVVIIINTYLLSSIAQVYTLVVFYALYKVNDNKANSGGQCSKIGVPWFWNVNFLPSL